MNDPIARVKLFFLDELKQWVDKGIGLASISSTEIEILSEETTNESILHCFLENIIPYKQSDTILCWSDQHMNHYALSFQQPERANAFWSVFCEILGMDKSLEPSLPPPIPENLDEIANIFLGDYNLKSISQEWLRQLTKETMKSKENREVMVQYFVIYKELINLGKMEIYQGLLLSEDFIAIFAVLEFDSDISFRQDFVAYFTENVRFNNFLEISDKKFVDEVHLAHRILCLKESLMSKSFRETTIQILWSFHLSVWNEIIAYYTSLSEVRAKFILQLTENTYNSFAFLNEVVNSSKFISNQARMQFYESLDRDGIIKSIQKKWFLEREDSLKIKRVILEVFYCTSQLLPKLMIENFGSFEEKYYILIFKDTITCDLDIVQKSMDILKLLLQPQHLACNQTFFKDIYDEIIAFYVERLNPGIISEDNYDSTNEILGLLSHCLRVDTVTVRFFFISNNIINILNSLIKSCAQEVKVSAIKVLKSIISRKDSFLINSLIKSETISIVLDLFHNNCSRENLFFSCVLSLLTEIKNCELKSLNQYMCGLLARYDSELLNSYFNAAKKNIEQVEFRRSRSVSFDLTSNESFQELDNTYNDFDMIFTGKRSSESFDEPVKKFKKSND